MSQLTASQMERILPTLPTTGNGEWHLSQKITAKPEGTIVGSVLIIGPGSKHVGDYVRDGVFRPHGSVSYWYIRQMRDAGWHETEEMIDNRKEA